MTKALVIKDITKQIKPFLDTGVYSCITKRAYKKVKSKTYVVHALAVSGPKGNDKKYCRDLAELINEAAKKLEIKGHLSMAWKLPLIGGKVMYGIYLAFTPESADKPKLLKKLGIKTLG